MAFSNKNCFLCGTELNQDNKTDEHIFPKWLQAELDLWNKEIFLLNRTSIPYRKLVIPCCKTCNNVYLSKLEDIVQSSFDEGYLGFKNLSDIQIYQWAGKIFYGLLFKELSLRSKQSNPESGYITNPKLISEYEIIHFFLQSVRKKFIIENFEPGSVFIFNLLDPPSHLPPEIKNDMKFNYIDDFIENIIVLKLKNIGIVVCLSDSGLIKRYFQELLNAINGNKIHMMQFDEICARIVYQETLRNRGTHFVSSASDEDGAISVMGIPGLSKKSYFDDWNNLDYLKYLKHFMRKWPISEEDLFQEPDLIASFIEKGDIFRFVDENGQDI